MRLHHALRGASAFSLEALTNGLILHYTMENINGSTLVDETGNADATIFGEAVSGSDSGTNYLNFDSIDDYTKTDPVPGHPVSNPSLSGALTLVMRLYCSGGDYIFSSGAQTSSRGVTVMNRNPAYIQVKAGTASWTTRPELMPQNQWFTFLMQWNGTELSVEYNGVVKSVVSGDERSVTDVYTEITLGTPTTSIGQYLFNGRIGPLRAYNRVLTEQEKSAIYQLMG